MKLHLTFFLKNKVKEENRSALFIFPGGDKKRENIKPFELNAMQYLFFLS